MPLIPRGPQSAYCPAFLIIGPHFAISDWRSLCSASGLARSSLTGSAPSLARLALRSASLIASCRAAFKRSTRSEEHTSELQSRLHLVCRLLLEKKKYIHPTHLI